MDASLIICIQTMLVHQMPGSVVSPWNSDFLQDSSPLQVGEGSNSVFHVAHNTHGILAHANISLPIDLPNIIVPNPLSACSLVVHISSPSLAMDVNGNVIDYDGCLQCFGSHAPPYCPHEVSCAIHLHLFGHSPLTLSGICCIIWSIGQVYTWIRSCT